MGTTAQFDNTKLKASLPSKKSLSFRLLNIKSFLRQLTMTTNGHLFPLNLFVVQCISCITRMITCASLKNLSNLYSIHWHSIWISFWIKVLIKQNVWSLSYNSFDSSRLIVDVIDSLRVPCFFFLIFLSKSVYSNWKKRCSSFFSFFLFWFVCYQVVFFWFD